MASMSGMLTNYKKQGKLKSKKKSKNFIAGAIKHPGALTKKANAVGESPMDFAQENKSAAGQTGKQARFALLLKSFKKK